MNKTILIGIITLLLVACVPLTEKEKTDVEMQGSYEQIKIKGIDCAHSVICYGTSTKIPSCVFVEKIKECGEE